MLNRMLRLYETNLASEQDLPRNTSVIGNGGGQSAGGLLGSTEIVMVANTDVTLTSGKSIIMEFEDSSDNELFHRVPFRAICTATDEVNSKQPYDVILRLPLPSDAREYVRIVISTDDESVSGKVDVVFDYLPRG